MTLAALIGALMACLAAQMFFSASEIAVVSADELKVKAAASLGQKRAGLLNWLLERRERLLAAILTGTNLATVTSAVVLTSYLHNHTPRQEFIAPFILAPLSLLLGESLPKLMTLKRPLAFAIFAVVPAARADLHSRAAAERGDLCSAAGCAVCSGFRPTVTTPWSRARTSPC